MRTICLYFQVHQPFRLKKYRFFDIGAEHYYYDDFTNNAIMKKVASRCYLPTNKLLLDIIKEYGSQFKVAFSISGTAIEQFEKYAPEVIESFKKLIKTGSVEILAETNSHSLSSLRYKDEFSHEVRQHMRKIDEVFGVQPTVFRNTELVYSDQIGVDVAELGFKAMLTEGAKHILGWKSPNYLYYNAVNPKLKLLLKNFKLSDDIGFRFSNKTWDEWPLTAEKYVTWLNEIPKEEEIVNLFMDYETFGEHQWAETGIFEFLKALPKAVFENSDFQFVTPSEAADMFQPVAAMHAPYPISWADAERDLTAWLGNELQNEAFDKLYRLRDLVMKAQDKDMFRDWRYLKTSDHFYYMSTKFFSDGDVHMYFNPYDNPYDAFINFMNVLTDFTIRVKKATEHLPDEIPVPKELTPDEIKDIITKYEEEISYYKQKLAPKATERPVRKAASKSTEKPAAGKKTSKAKIETTEKPKAKVSKKTVAAEEPKPAKKTTKKTVKEEVVKETKKTTRKKAEPEIKEEKKTTKTKTDNTKKPAKKK